MGSKYRSQELPQEIVNDILSRLPVKSLTRFLLLSKHYHNLFNSPTFITDHLRHSMGRNSSLLFKSARGLNLLQNDCLTKVDIRALVSQRFQDFADDILDVNIVGCCNGLVCLGEAPRFSSGVNKIWVVNPATRQVTRIYPINHPTEEYSCSIGFGFHISSNDYKIVIVFLYEEIVYFDEDKDPGFASGSVSIYSRASNTCNKRVYDCLKKVWFDDRSNSVMANNALYWIGGVRGLDMGLQNLFVSFDLVNEEFTTIAMPISTNEGRKVIAVVEDSPAVLFFSGGDRSADLHIDLWILKKGVSEGWTKQCTVTVSFVPLPLWESVFQPIAVLKNEVVLRSMNLLNIGTTYEYTFDSVIFVSDDPCREFTCTFGSPFSSPAFIYAESLVSVA